MSNFQLFIKNYLEYCSTQKRLNEKTIKAYKIDLEQFYKQTHLTTATEINQEILESYTTNLHATYKPKTVKRKIASLKAFLHYLEYREIIDRNPFNKIQIRFREAVTLPKTIPLYTIEKLLSTMHTHCCNAKTSYQRRNALRDTAVIELLFATGMRISELCTLKCEDVNLYDGIILIHGKGNKERRIQIGNEEVLQILNKYNNNYKTEIKHGNHFFVNQSGNTITDQSVRRMLNKYTALAGIDSHITPHMFRHTFATSLLEADVDIRYIQEMLGHSSINVTEIYTHVAVSKQKDILTNKHPRKNFSFSDN